MDAKVGDRISLDAKKVGQARRTGSVRALVEGLSGVRYEVVWDDGSISVISPGAGVLLVEAKSAKRNGKKTTPKASPKTAPKAARKAAKKPAKKKAAPKAAAKKKAAPKTAKKKDKRKGAAKRTKSRR